MEGNPVRFQFMPENKTIKVEQDTKLRRNASGNPIGEVMPSIVSNVSGPCRTFQDLSGPLLDGRSNHCTNNGH